LKERKAIPNRIVEQLLIQCGYKCSVPRCDVAQSLEFHHINRKPTDNREENIVVLCAVHHHQAHVGKISAEACLIMKELLPHLSGLSLAVWSELSLSKEEFSSFLDLAREIPKESLRVISEQYFSHLSKRNEGYYCRLGIKANDFLVSRKLLYRADDKVGPPLWKISERGLVFCRFLYNSQYFLPFAAFDKKFPKDDIIRWNFEGLPWETS
jgi:hypothetical protein